MCWCTIMLEINVFLFTSLVVIAPVQSSIRIQEAAVKPLERGDIGIVFRFTVENEGLSPVIVSASMVQCCEIVQRNETDCEHMKLVSSQRLLLTQGSSSDVHLLYPTLYPHQRKGSCLVEVSSETAPGEAPPPPESDSASPDATASSNATSCSFSLTQNITFDTTVFLTVVPPILKYYYDLAEVKWRFDMGKFLNPTLETEVCDSPDEDPMDMCLPVDCIIKYSGSRSYFDPKSRLCVKVPLCESNANADLPTVAYHPMSNICLDLENPLTDEDIEFLTIGVVEQETSYDLDVVEKCLNGAFRHHDTIAPGIEERRSFRKMQEKGNSGSQTETIVFQEIYKALY
ncbi:uncharacterized protein LOC124165375 isoform X2 [Ischnura elegans]|uniref:uncharacterized protein LOC124165375 isoform X2 n=1 Tax=Ischnura elegans TaxID=197161 RepID=UPI001ED87A73|nr:uncharacterized protein LOC124165375 isoform X2 [Ischnura elegans]